MLIQFYYYSQMKGKGTLHMVGKYPVITLCGSTKFKDEFMDAQKKLTLAGNIVISVGLFGHSGDEEVWEGMDEGTLTQTKEMLDDMHKRKIDMADSIFVINVGGYIGESTRSEIAYAKAAGKQVLYLEEMAEETTQESDSKQEFPGEKFLRKVSLKQEKEAEIQKKDSENEDSPSSKVNKVKIKLDFIMESLGTTLDGVEYFYDLEKQECFYSSDFGDFSMYEEDYKKLLEEEPDRFLKLPGKYEISGHEMMEDFVNGLPEGPDRELLQRDIQGRGASRRFKNGIRRFGIEQEWADYQTETYRKFAVEWCRKNGIAFE